MATKREVGVRRSGQPSPTTSRVTSDNGEQGNDQRDPILDVHVVRCGDCGQPVTSAEPYTLLGDDFFHARCFGVRGTSDDG